MAITIQELIASDTISQAVDKINFNFDQLLLNGGGPVGPSGPTGPTGPVGGRGLRGATWYNDPAPSPGTDPNTLIIATVEEDDFYLQANGDVWKYNGTLWVITPVNLIGPTGPSGSSFGFNYAGGYPGAASINNQNTAFIVPMPGGTSAGASQGTNEGISVPIFGGVATTAIPPTGITFTNAFLIPDLMIKSLDSSLLSILVHQKDSSSAAIKFMGGGAIPGDKFEQTTLSNLSDISLGIDDSLNINVPKPATSPVSVSDLIGFNLNTLKRGQQFYSGKQINFISGIDNVYSGVSGEISDISFVVGTSNTSTPAKFSVATTFASATTAFEVGGNIALPVSPTTKTGTILGQANNITLWGNTVQLAYSVGNYIRVNSTGVELLSTTGPLSLQTVSQAINISAATTLDLQASTAINVYTGGGGDINLYTTNKNIYLEQAGAVHSLRVDNTSTVAGGTKIKGNLTWGVSSYIGNVASYRHIHISADGIATNKPAIWVLRNDPAATTAASMAKFAKNDGAGNAIEEVNINTASVYTSTNSGNAGFSGFWATNAYTGGALATGFGLRADAYDTVSGVYSTKFWASENTTAVGNRFQYVRKYLPIDPMTAGITSGTGYTVPSNYMDASFLDIHIGSFSGTGGVAPSFHEDWDITIPNGLYSGQRLQLHVIVQPGRHYDGGIQYNWPASGNIASIGVKLNSFINGTSAVIGTPSCSAYDLLPSQFAGELFAELLWIGQTYTTQWEDSSSITNKTSQRGWVITNVVTVNYPGPYSFDDTAVTTLNIT